MPIAEIITIGTEILLGEIIDTNAPYIARALCEIGIDLYRMVSVGDNEQRIAQAIQQSCERADIIITTGGLGPTVDDPTREAIALAFGVQTEFRPELWEQIQARFRRFGTTPTENNKRQAYIPQGAKALENPVGTAPAFILEGAKCVVISMPGVPREMEYLIQNAVVPYLQRRFPNTGVIRSRVLHVAGVGESQIDNLIGDLETFHNPTVGLAAHSGQVDVRITAKAGSEAEAEDMLCPVEETLRQRLGDWIYGIDQETLEEAVLQVLKQHNWRLAVVEAGLGGALIRRLSVLSDARIEVDLSATQREEIERRYFLGGEVLPAPIGLEELKQAAQACRQAHAAEVCLGVSLRHENEKQDIDIVLLTSNGEQQLSRPYGGPPKNAINWAVNHGLNLIRKL
jgi:competence/damage-inducible protein CinA-like protein